MTASALVATALVAGARFSQRLPGPTYESPTEGSPGFAGFVATFALALAIIALGVSFTRRMRRSAHRERLRGTTEAEGGAQVGAGDEPVDGSGTGAAPQPTAGVDPAADGGVDEPPPAGERA